jgi:transcriptional regulator with XRE-family HTH domain
MPRKKNGPARKPIKNFGKAVRLQRQALGYSLEQLATEAHITAAYLSLIERGQVNIPSPEKVVAICWALGTPRLYREASNRTYKELFRLLDKVDRLQGQLPMIGGIARMQKKLYTRLLQCATDAVGITIVEDGLVSEEELTNYYVHWCPELVPRKGKGESISLKQVYRFPIKIARREAQPL